MYLLDVRPGREEVEADSGWEVCDSGDKSFSDIVGLLLGTYGMKRE